METVIAEVKHLYLNRKTGEKLDDFLTRIAKETQKLGNVTIIKVYSHVTSYNNLSNVTVQYYQNA